MMEKNRIQLRINIDAAKASNPTISSEGLRASDVYLLSVAAGVPPAVEPGILPGGLSCGLRRHLRVQSSDSGRQDFALYGSQDGWYVFSVIAARANGARTLVRRKVGWRRGLETSQRGSAVPTFLRDKPRAPGQFLAGALNRYDGCRYSRKATLNNYTDVVGGAGGAER